MLLGFGIRLGAPARVFQAIGSVITGAGAAGIAITSRAAIVGVLLHVLVMLASGVVYVALLGDSDDQRATWAITIGASVAATAFILARTFAGSIALVLTPGNLVALGVVIAITLPIGMRFAPSRM
jgi:predicted Na+-dependent transporter